MTSPSRRVRVDIWSDVACPWCYIGKRKFEAGAEAFLAGHDDVELDVTFHSYELAPDTPVDFDGDEVEFLVRHKGLDPEQVQGMLERVTGIAASVGLRYDFAALQHTNTRLAHEVLHHAKQLGRQAEMKERLLRAYFVEGRHIGRIDDLADLAAEIGLDRDRVTDALRAHAHQADVAADIAQAQAYGIRGVPFFVIDESIGVSGAQDPQVFRDALEQALAARVR